MNTGREDDDAASTPKTPPAATSFWMRSMLTDPAAGRARPVWFSAWLVMLTTLHPVVTTGSRGIFDVLPRL